MKKKLKFRLSVWQWLAIAYLVGTLLGSVLLVLPFATKSGEEPTSYVNALFTSASAVSMTGLSPYDTFTHWSLFGQLVILFLMQMSGLGFMTIVSAMFLIFKRGLGFGSKNAFILDSRGKYNGVGTLLKRIVIGTFIFETVGALILMIRFIPDYGAGNGIYFAIWHSVSAFCNAGFDILGNPQTGTFVSLSQYVKDPLVTLTISALIILGALGFAVWGDIIDCKGRFKKFQLNTKVVLIVNAILIIGGTGLFLLFEYNNKVYEGFNFGEKLLASFFNAVTPRSAGFFTTRPSDLSASGYGLTVILMFIGGGSGSTAGGLRVGTFAVLVMGMLANFRGYKDITIGKKRIENSLLSQSLGLLATLITTVIIATLAICALDTNLSFEKVLFESVSALSNSGLGVVDYVGDKVSVVSRLILTFLMYAGRVGALNLALAIGENRHPSTIKRPIDSVLIG